MDEERKARIREAIAAWKTAGDTTEIFNKGRIELFRMAANALAEEVGSSAVVVDGRVYLVMMEGDYSTYIVDRSVEIL